MDVGDNSLDAGIRTRLQRIAAEVSARVIGYEGRKPPPVSLFAERGNSLLFYSIYCSPMNKLETALRTSFFINNSTKW